LLRSLARGAAASVGVFLAITSFDATALADPAAASPFATCARQAGDRWTYDDLLCLDRVGRQYGKLAETRRRLRSLGGGDVEHPWPTLVLGQATFEHDETAAIALFEVAAEGFVRSREHAGEVLARQNLSNLYRRRGAFEAAGRQVERAVSAAESSQEPLTIARATVIQANHALATGGDIGGALRSLLRGERLAFPGAPIGLRRSILFSLAHALLSLGRFEEAIDALERHRALRTEDGSPVNAAIVAYDLLYTRVAMAELRPTADARRKLVAEAEAVVAEAAGLKQPRVEGEAHRVLGDLLRTSDPDRAERHLRRCLELESALGHPDVRAACLWSLSLQRSARDPRRADQFSREALALVSANPRGPLLASAWQARLPLVWRALPGEQAIAESLEALEAIERLRAGEKDGDSRVALFGNWGRAYRWLTGRLLEASPPRVAQALEVGERLRARVLLEHLAQADVTTTAHRDEDTARQQLALRIADTQRRLLSATLSQPQRHTLLDDLELLELEESELDRGRIAPVSSSVPFATLELIRQSLDDREAMIWFSIAPWKDLYDEFGGGSWVVSITRRSGAVHPLSAGGELDGQVAALTGLLRHRRTDRETWSAAARSLGRTLLATALSQLPAEVDRLVVVADGVLHRVPFEALWPDSGTAPLGERFEISLVPSATVWLHLRRSRVSPSVEALVLADPAVSRGSPDGETRLDALPWARQEAAAIARLLDLDADHVLTGSAASERFLKTAPLSTFGVLHLAAHARADGAFPQRSAVFLAPGAESEDGWLQPREIAALDLRGQLIVLSACESADGALLSGEGPLSLARAFFAAGAGGVVATRWPLRDDDAAFVMTRFYRALAAGDSVGAALRRARRDVIDAGLPPAAWAGVTLLGDGSHRPIRPRHHPVTTAWLAIVAAALAAVGFVKRAHLYRFARRTNETR
jgi:CHAT domain-containing protein